MCAALDYLTCSDSDHERWASVSRVDFLIHGHGKDYTGVRLTFLMMPAVRSSSPLAPTSASATSVAGISGDSDTDPPASLGYST
jgi:hypothetical protein